MTPTLLRSFSRTSTVSAYTSATPQSSKLARVFGTGGTVLLNEDCEILYASLFGLPRTSTFGISARDNKETSTRRAINEIRLKTGLTWNQLSMIFRVDRRSLHYWASGKALSASHEAQLFLLLRLVRQIDRGSARANRAILLTPLGESNQSPFEKLVSGDYEEVFALLGSPGSIRRRSAMPSAEQVTSKLPAAPFVFDGDIDDSPLATPSIYRASKRVKVDRGQST